MIVLHFGLRDRQPLVWAEAAAGSFAQVAALRAALDLRKLAEQSATLWLPTADGRPVPSQPLLGEPPAGEASLAAWTVPAVAPTPAELIDLLARPVDRATLQPGVLVGASWRAFAAIQRFAAALVVRERFLPAFDDRATPPRAVWRPVFDDRSKLAKLAAALPGVARAIGTDDAPPDRPALEVVTTFLQLAVDAIVRSALTPSVDRGRSVHDRWLSALRSADGTLKLSSADQATLRSALGDWRRPIDLAEAASFRLAFRLKEPPAQTVAWTVRYLLQAHDDPSLILPLEGKLAKTTAKKLDLPPREFVLASLGQAARLAPDIEKSLHAAQPTGFMTDAVGAHRFLSQTAPALEQAGFGVMLPGWWTRVGARQRLALTATAKTPNRTSGGMMTLEDVVEFDWKVALGDIVLSRAELEALANVKAPLVHVRGQWVQVGADELRAALAFLDKQSTTTGTARDALALAAGVGTGPGGFAVQGIKATGSLTTLLDQLSGSKTFAELPAPAGLAATLRPYQGRGYSWLAFLRRIGLGACLADDMGLGKSVQMLAALLRARDDGETRPALLVCPTSVIGHWRNEAKRFAPELSLHVHHGATRAKGTALARQLKEVGLVVCGYPILLRDAAALAAIPWSGVILDEAQNIKNPDAKQAKAARALTAGYRVALTGTPVENNVGDLWAIGQFLNPGYLGNREQFRREFIVPIQVRREPEAAARLQKLATPFLLRRLKTDRSIIADLPAKNESKLVCTLTKEQGSLYAAVVGELGNALAGVEGFARKGIVLGALTKLKQVCNHPAQFTKDGIGTAARSGKLTRLLELLDEIDQTGERALVFTQFTDMGDILQARVQEAFGREVPYLHGSVPLKKREAMVTRFQAADADGPRVFLISLKAGGTGLTLTAANHVFHYDRWWNPAVENQATDRAYRTGQTKNVQVHKFVCAGTLEEKIDEMIELKKAVAGQVVGSGEGWLTELSNDALRDLVRLRAEAVEE